MLIYMCNIYIYVCRKESYLCLCGYIYRCVYIYIYICIYIYIYRYVDM
jgi:hypothetical protein